MSFSGENSVSVRAGRCLSVFWRRVVENEEFMDAAFETIENVIWAAECLRVMPGFLQV